MEPLVFESGPRVNAKRSIKSYMGPQEARVMNHRPLITYIRVSTSQQGRSGLGIEAQRHALSQFAQAEGFGHPRVR